MSARLARQKDHATLIDALPLLAASHGLTPRLQLAGTGPLLARLQARAARRVKELRLRGVESIESRVLKEMQDRDARDIGRAVAPLIAAEDALKIDTTGLTPGEVFDRALTYLAVRLE